MSEEPDTIHETETPTDDGTTSTTDDTTEPEKNQRRYTFLSRHISTLRALRLSGILTIISAIILYAALGGSNNAFGPSDGLRLIHRGVLVFLS